MKKTIKKITALVLCLIMLIGAVPLVKDMIPGILNANAEDTKKDADVDKNGFLTYNAVPDGFADAVDPYGYGKDTVFPYTTKSETFYYKCAKYEDDEEVTYYSYVYDQMTSKNRGFSKNINDASDKLGDIAKLNFTQAVSFDGDGTGRNRYVGIVGIDASTVVKVYVYDAKGNKLISSVSLGKMTNINDSSQFYEASNHLSIVAGDFDGDGKDSLVVYATIKKDVNDSDDSTRYGLFELKMNYTNGLVSGIYCVDNNTYGNKELLNQTYESERKTVKILQDQYVSDERNKPCVSMAVGDINNDKIDDLVVLSYMGEFNIQDEVHFEASTPYLAVAYGNKSRSKIVSCRDAGYYVHDGGNSGNYETIASPGVAVTNADGTGGDEVIVAGEALTVETKNNKYNDETRTEKIRIARYYYDGTNLVRNYLKDGEEENQMTKNTIDNDDYVFAQIKVAGVYMDGRGNPASIFINGDFYDLSDGSTITKDYTYAAVNENPNERSIQFVYSFATGNFEHNDNGFEQISFIVAEKEKKQDDYDIYWATVGKDSEGKYTATSDMRKDGSDTEIYDNKGDNLSECLSALVVSVDVDDDGVIARYSGVEYCYSDPDVLAVLQAGPYFEDLGDFYSNNNETTYSLSESRGAEKAKSNSVSFSYAATVGVDLEVVEMSASLGYALDWTETYSNSIEYELKKTWKAQGEDTVVVYRTPIFIYKYDCLDSKGNWQEESLCMSVPMKPVFTTMTVPEYNEFCDQYNNQDSVKNYNSKKTTEKKTDLVYTMTKLDKDNLYLGNEGNPYGYCTTNETTEDFKKYGDLQTPGTADACTEVEYTETMVSSVTTEIAHGLHFGMSFSAGATVKVGVETSLDYLNGKSSTTSIGKGTSFSCNIQNPVKSAMLEAGYTEAQHQSYSFSWQLASWNSGIAAKSGKEVPVVGYVLSNVSALPHPPANATAVATDTDEDGIKDKIDVSWESSNSDDEYPNVSAYNVYLENEDGEPECIMSNFTGTEFTYQIQDERKEHVFIIRGVLNGLETLDGTAICDSSNVMVIIKSIDKISSEGLVDKYQITYTGTKKPTYFYVTNGENAYDVAVKNGYKGTKDEWMKVIGADCQYNGHTYTDTKSDATCTEKGYTIHKCSKCGDVVIDTFVNALGHNYSKQVVNPTCTDMGYTVYTCSRCSEKHVDDIVSALGHKYSATVVAPTCTDSGYTKYTCEKCQNSYVDDVVSALGHKYSATVVEPTCTDSGYTKYTCEKCQNSYVDDVVPATEHDYKAVITAPTCTEKGYTTYTCKDCGDQYVSDIEETVKHNFATKVVENTCVSGGYTIKYCVNCGYQEIIDETAAKSHNYEVTSVTPATCMSKGYSTYTCKDCGVSYIGDEIAPLDHEFVDDVVAPTCTEKGYTVHYCKNCGFERIINRTEMTDHNWELTEIIAPTCTVKGFSIYTCSGCGIIKKADVTECISHTPGEWFCDDYAVGHYIQRCEKCYCKLDEKTVSVSIGGSEGETTIAQGESYSMVYGNIIDLNTSDAETNYKYVSSDTDVAVVNENGEVEAVGAGTAIITITDEDTGITTSFTVKIAKPWWQKVHDILSNLIPFKILFMIFGIRY